MKQNNNNNKTFTELAEEGSMKVLGLTFDYFCDRKSLVLKNGCFAREAMQKLKQQAPHWARSKKKSPARE